jgi:hypothetical protein
MIETYIENRTVYINDGKDPMIEYYLNECLGIEKSF